MSKITPQILLTFITINKAARETLNTQLYGQLKNGIYQGLLRAGDRLPSSREMSAGLKISRNSVLQVFEQLTMEGFFESRTGSGTFISKGLAKLPRSKNLPKHTGEKPGRAAARGNGLNNAFKGHVSALEPLLPFQCSAPLISEFPFAAWARVQCH